MNKVKSVLFVCTGNSCRSVMAEGLLKKYLKEAGKSGIKVASAGISGFGGMPPTEETKEVLKTEGIDLSGFKSRGVTPEMIKEADLILALEGLHKDEILKLAPEAAGKTYLLKEFNNPSAKDREESMGIPDPIGRPIEFYKYVFALIKKETERISKIL